MPDKRWMCALCFNEKTGPMEFETEEDYKEHNRKYHPTGEPNVQKPVEKPKITEELPELAKPQPQPIQLTYKYIGTCSFCKGEVETIELDVGVKIKEHVCLAWCNNCKKKLSQRKVVKLS